MSYWYSVIKWLHVLSSTVLFGTGLGIAFFFLRAHRTADVKIIAAVSREVVLADMLFTAVAAVLQPATGIALVLRAGFPLSSRWLLLSIALYALVGCCWLAVVRLQVRMRDLAINAARAGGRLPGVYQSYYRWWFALGWPAFVGVMVIFYLMVAKPGF